MIICDIYNCLLYLPVTAATTYLLLSSRLRRPAAKLFRNRLMSRPTQLSYEALFFRLFLLFLLAFPFTSASLALGSTFSFVSVVTGSIVGKGFSIFLFFLLNQSNILTALFPPRTSHKLTLSAHNIERSKYL